MPGIIISSEELIAFQLCWRRLLRVPWIASRLNQSIVKNINPEYALEGLKLKLQYFGLLLQRGNRSQSFPWKRLMRERLKANGEGGCQGENEMVR